jgi:WD40 repeat protein
VAYSVDNWRRTQAFDLAVVQSFGAFSPGGRFLAAADSNSIEVRDARSGAISAAVEMIGVTSLAVSPDGRLLVAADDEGAVNAWTLPPAAALWRAHLVLPPPAYAQVVYDVQFAAQGLLALASKPAGVNNTLVEVWPIRAGQNERPKPAWQSVMLNADYQTFAPAPDGSRVILATEDGYWLLQANNERQFIDGYYDAGEHAVIAFSLDGREAAGIEAEGGWIYDVASHAMREIDAYSELDEPTDVAWSPDGDALLITSEDGLVLCVRAEDGFTYRGVIDDSTGFEAAAFLDGHTIAAKRGDTLVVLTTES